MDASFHHAATGQLQAWRTSIQTVAPLPLSGSAEQSLTAHQTTVQTCVLRISVQACTTPAVRFPAQPFCRTPDSGSLNGNRDKAPTAPLVLIANDQEWSARSLESILGPNGYAVVRAYTGQQALERARTSQPDLIILDAQMPDMHGFEVCRALRSDPRFSATTPIVITTSGPSGPYPAPRGVSRRGLGVPGAAPRRRSAPAQARTPSCSASGRWTGCGRRVCSIRARACTTCAGSPAGRSEIGAEAFRRRDPVACVVFAPETEVERRRRPPRRRPAGCPTRWRSSSDRRAAPPTPSAGWDMAEYACDRAGYRPRGRGAPRAPPRVGRWNPPRFPMRGGERTLRLRAGYCAVPDFAESSVDAVELLLRATTALRDLKREGTAGERIRAFDQVPTKFTN